MPPKPSLPPKSDALPDDLRREDQQSVPPDSLPDATDETGGDDAQGAHTLAPDGGVAEHPIHDDDPAEDFTSGDYERQIEDVARARRDDGKRSKAEEP